MPERCYTGLASNAIVFFVFVLAYYNHALSYHCFLFSFSFFQQLSTVSILIAWLALYNYFFLQSFVYSITLLTSFVKPIYVYASMHD